MRRFAERTGRAYRLFDYAGHPEAERVVVLMGSGAETAHETVDWLVAHGREGRRPQGPPLPALRRRALRRGAAEDRPRDRRARPHQGAGLGRRAALPGRRHRARRRRESAAARPKVVGGRYGLSSKEFTPAMIAGVFEELARPQPRNHFTVGIVDDVTHTSLPWDPELDIEPDDVVARRLLRPGLRRHRRRQQELHRRSSARRPTSAPRPTSSTTRRSPARSRSRTCASRRGRSARHTSSAGRASSRATSSSS